MRLVAAEGDGASKRNTALSLATAVTMPDLPSMAAATQALPAATPISPRPAARTQFLPRSLETQTPPFAPEPMATNAEPSALMETRVSCPKVPTNCHFQPACVVSAKKICPLLVEAAQRLPLASMSTDSQSALFSTPRVTSVQAMPFWPNPVGITRPPLAPSLISDTCMASALGSRKLVITTL